MTDQTQQRTYLERVIAGEGTDVFIDLMKLPQSAAIAIAADIGYELGREHEQYSDTWVDWMFLMDESAFNDMTKGKGADDASA